MDRKRLNADGGEPTAVMRGMTIPRPLHESFGPISEKRSSLTQPIRKEFTAEMLGATEVVEYNDPQEGADALREQVRYALASDWWRERRE